MYRVISTTQYPCEEQGNSILIIDYFYYTSALFEKKMREEQGHTNIIIDPPEPTNVHSNGAYRGSGDADGIRSVPSVGSVQ